MVVHVVSRKDNGLISLWFDLYAKSREFDLPTLRKIASETRAEHFWAQSLEDLENNFRTIDKLEKTESRSMTVTDDRELYAWFVGVSLLAGLGFAVYISLGRTSG